MGVADLFDIPVLSPGSIGRGLSNVRLVAEDLPNFVGRILGDGIEHYYLLFIIYLFLFILIQSNFFII